ncbi:hypothetical protein GCM10012275_05340 [Longimycelium tulufanense]|uniref:DUF4352 domain-containing protein n=1 Tax=Longimycelium tulufanense TaxID=907463 RepID=A0A8J3CC01_9PSEU|nr:DUF4190 domain-containing protein [Longimycelium tulufanense]GGM37125.1 hypothetical protein GCM10012275_05340 [Longimycelium tulufanense]
MTTPAPPAPMVEEEPAPRPGPWRNGLGTASLVLGLVGIACGLTLLLGALGAVCGVVGLVLGILARKRVSRRRATNGGTAAAGIATSALAVVAGSLAVVLLVKTGDHLAARPDRFERAPDSDPLPSVTLDLEELDRKREPATAPVGTPLEPVGFGTDEITVTVTGVRRDVPAENGYVQPKRGEFLAADVEVKAIRVAETVDVHPLKFKVVYADGEVAQATFYSGQAGKRLTVTRLNTGQHVSGTLVFDVDPARVAGAKIQFADPTGQPAAYWTIG